MRPEYVSTLDDLWTRAIAPRKSNAPTVVSTFAGAGGSSLGYHAAGFNELLAVEWEPHAAAQLRANFHMKVYEGDIANVTADMIDLKPGELDVLDGSPPCQGFSLAGKRNPDDARNNLFLEYTRLANVWCPKVLVMENVPGMLLGHARRVFNAVVAEMRKAGTGYNVSVKVLNGDALGGASIRKRLIFIGVRKDIGVPVFPKPEYGYTVREAFHDVPPAEHSDIPASLQNLIAYVPKGKNAATVIPWGFNIVKLQWDRPSNTLPKYIRHASLIHPGEPRFLTTAEMKRVQGFPDQYVFSGTPQQIQDRIGNSVMPPVSYRIAATISRDILHV